MPVDPWTSPTAFASSETATQAFMAKVYRWMAGGLALTGVVAAVFASYLPALLRAAVDNPGLGTALTVTFFALMIGQFVMVVAFGRMVRSASFAAVAAMFVAFCAVEGLFFSMVLLQYTGASVASTFFITGGTFLAMSAYGTLTKKDLSSWSSFLMMGLMGVIIAGVVNLFLRSSAMEFVLACAGVVIFTGLAAYDTQKIRAWADANDDRLALSGALSLYLDFINLFLSLLRLLGKRR